MERRRNMYKVYKAWQRNLNPSAFPIQQSELECKQSKSNKTIKQNKIGV